MSRPTETLVVFDIRGRAFALPLDRVFDVLRMAAVEPVPGSPDWMLGLLNVRGECIPVVDIGRRLDIRDARIHPDDRVIIARTKTGLAGGVVENVNGALVEPDELVATDARIPAAGVVAVARIGTGLVSVLDADRLWNGALATSGRSA